MKKNLVCGLLLLSVLTLSLNSCRTDEMLTGTEQTQKEKIAFFERFEKDKSLSKNAESNNYALPFGNSMIAYFNNYPEKKTELENKYGTVDLKVSSQDIDLENGRKLLIFPMLTDGKVTAVIGGVINAERDYLYFDVYKEGHPDRDYLIQTFQQHYSSLILVRTIDVGEVVIIVKKPELKKPDPWDEDPGDGGHDMGGGPGDYGGGGSGNTPNTPNTTNPCEQTKNIVNNSKSKPAIDSLKQQSKLTGGKEKGFKVNSDGTTTAEIKGGAHHVDLGDTAGYLGGYHNHTPSGIKMFSPPDIAKMLSFAMAQTNGNIGNGFMGMIGSEPCSSCPDGYKYYHYMINFNGTSQELAGFLYNANWDLESLKDDYRDKEKELSENLSYTNQLGGNLNSNGLQKLFFDTLKNMKMEGKVSLQKIEDNGTVQSVILNSNGSSTTAIPCP